MADSVFSKVSLTIKIFSVSSENAKVPIIDAARRGNLPLLEECLKAGVSVNALDKAGSSALHAAAQGGHQDCVLRLLQDPKLEIDLQVIVSIVV